ncbi:hypothetical protein B0H14DRAFT_3133597 [Mycena olivaceomarginata]|nr:hypothetical protein B0H14DRAFT_3133597 [Mycena olivaceomarginata]
MYQASGWTFLAQGMVLHSSRLSWVAQMPPSSDGKRKKKDRFGRRRFENLARRTMVNLEARRGEYTKAAGVPYARFFNGMITEFLPFLVGFDKDHRTITLVGRGDAAVSFTSIADIAGFVAYVLTTLPPSEVANRTFLVQGDRATMNELGPIFKVEVQHTDKIAGPMREFKTMMLLLTDTGVGSTGWDAERKAEKSGSEAAGSANALWPGHHWRSIKEVHNL